MHRSHRRTPAHLHRTPVGRGPVPRHGKATAAAKRAIHESSLRTTSDIAVGEGLAPPAQTAPISIVISANSFRISPVGRRPLTPPFFGFRPHGTRRHLGMPPYIRPDRRLRFVGADDSAARTFPNAKRDDPGRDRPFSCSCTFTSRSQTRRRSTPSGIWSPAGRGRACGRGCRGSPRAAPTGGPGSRWTPRGSDSPCRP